MKNKQDELYLKAVELLDGFLQLAYCARKLLCPTWAAENAIKWGDDPIGWILGNLVEGLESHDEAIREIIDSGQQLVAIAGNLGAPCKLEQTNIPESLPPTIQALEQLQRTMSNVNELLKDNKIQEEKQWPKRVN
jgi:hypothetical protein